MLSRMKFAIEREVTEILDQLPESVWTSNTITFLDPAFGGGQFVRAIEQRLRAHGHSDTNIRNRVFGFEASELHVRFARNKYKLVGQYSKMPYNKFFELDNNMKFDVIVGNPPYQDSNNKAANNKLWHKFTTQITTGAMLKSGGIISLITPSSIFNTSVGYGKWFAKNVLSTYQLVNAKIHNRIEENPFNVGVQTCYWTLAKDSIEPSITVPLLRDTTIDVIVNKIDRCFPKLPLVHENSHVNKSNFSAGSTTVFYSGNNTANIGNKIENSGQLKIVYPFSASYKSQFVTTGATCHFNRVFFVTDADHAARIMSYTNSKLYKFFADNFLKTSGFTPAVKNNRLPLLEDKIWTNSELYAHFGLTQEEIDYVEANVK